MTTPVKLKIGAYTFQIAPRDEMDFDFGRSIYKVDTVGIPTYQDLGVDEKKLDFSGSLIGNDAWKQAELLESIMDSGQPVTLQYGPVQRTVRIESVSPKLKRFDRVDYDISLIIIPSKTGYAGRVATQSTTANAASTSTSKSPPVTSTSAIKQYADTKWIVKQGQSLWVIAQSAWGDGSLWPVIAKINGIKNERITAGEVLNLPSKAAIQNALNAYNNRVNAVITPAGISYLQSLEANAS